ncbi:hypothetical protein Back11_35830 [Paenibacillus baekrokdamisoli]|uniref:Glycosyltransferase 2-like domain-containing protein n=1 Tax=Paenibacillus baekrokdamisoli TaxID=1712516 RepID=A0A3G9JE12_9BACL|nr:hypothetical protein Back11_35830 [Paenibacillus baekrokdamisoli]
MKQGCGEAARSAFDRAWLLDPQALWVQAVQGALAAAPMGPARTEVDELLAVQPVTIAAAIMTLNEARCIERCVHSLMGAVDEIVIIDSGSTDGTIELVEHLPKVKIVHHIELNDDFAGKRNQGLSYINSDWVLWVDADEWLFEEDVAGVREAAGLFHNRVEQVVFNVCQVNYMKGKQSMDYGVPRMFPMNRNLQYYGRVHEQIVMSGADMYEGRMQRQSIRIRLHHDGYEPHILQARNKVNRNLRLLRMMVEEDPDNPGWLLYYGRETLATGDVDKAKQIFEEAAVKAQNKPNFGRLPDILMFLCGIHMNAKNYVQAEAVCRKALEVQPTFPDALYHLAQAQMRQAVALLQSAERHLQESKEAFQSYRGTVTADHTILGWKADVALADLTRLSGKHAEAKEKYEQILQKHPNLQSVRKQLEKL